jgi:hypothetical protein
MLVSEQPYTVSLHQQVKPPIPEIQVLSSTVTVHECVLAPDVPNRDSFMLLEAETMLTR